MNRLSILAEQISSEQKLEKIEIKLCSETSIGFITLNSPKDLNSLSEKMMDELCYALKVLQ